MLCMFKTCNKCKRDLVFDEGDWRCMQCARYFYQGKPSLPDLEITYHPTLGTGEPSDNALVVYEIGFTAYHISPASVLEDDGQRRVRKAGFKPRSPRSINSVIRAKNVGETRFWSRNKKVIEYLDQGLSVRDISRLMDLGPRQIRNVRERLDDLRVAAAVDHV